MKTEKTISYQNYYDKVLGCFLGKCICGTMGAPYEGMKQFLDLEYSDSMFMQSIPNDDLDIQLIWLELLEQYGETITSIDLAEAFYARYPHSPGEYAYFKKNIRRRIYPPASGSFQNTFYGNGMGSLIRSEIWACVNPLSPERAAEMAEKDACLDHKSDSIAAERYFAAMESIAFQETELSALLQKAEPYLEGSPKLKKLYQAVAGWVKSGMDQRQVRFEILRDYGHPDCTNLYQNIGIIWMALLMGGGDIKKTVMLAINSGFDTDCTAATAGAVLGLLLGGARLKELFSVSQVRFITEALVKRSDSTVETLASDIAAVGLLFSEKGLLDTKISDAPPRALPHPEKRPFTYDILYKGEPIAESCNEITITLHNHTQEKMLWTLNLSMPDDYRAAYPKTVSAEGHGNAQIVISLNHTGTSANAVSELEKGDSSLFSLNLNAGGNQSSIEFGLFRGTAYRVYGPYWENQVSVPTPAVGESYYDYLDGIDQIREYHLNMKSDFSRKYCESEHPVQKAQGGAGRLVFLNDSLFHMSDLFGFEGPCTAYIEREILCAEEKEYMLYVGKSDKIKLWLNGSLLAADEKITYCTCENLHIQKVILKKGINVLTAKLARTGHDAVFSLLLLEPGDPMAFPLQLPI